SIVLALTSNPGSKDFQKFRYDSVVELFEYELARVKEWSTSDNTMFVVWATRGEAFTILTKRVPFHFLLFQGVVAQGRSLQEVCEYGMNKDCWLLVNSTRGIIYASDGKDFAERARDEAVKLQKEMQIELEKAGLILAQ